MTRRRRPVWYSAQSRRDRYLQRPLRMLRALLRRAFSQLALGLLLLSGGVLIGARTLQGENTPVDGPRPAIAFMSYFGALSEGQRPIINATVAVSDCEEPVTVRALIVFPTAFWERIDPQLKEIARLHRIFAPNLADQKGLDEYYFRQALYKRPTAKSILDLMRALSSSRREPVSYREAQILEDFRYRYAAQIESNEMPIGVAIVDAYGSEYDDPALTVRPESLRVRPAHNLTEATTGSTSESKGGLVPRRVFRFEQPEPFSFADRDGWMIVGGVRAWHRHKVPMVVTFEADWRLANRGGGGVKSRFVV